jgi:hypothetical protein
VLVETDRPHVGHNASRSVRDEDPDKSTSKQTEWGGGEEGGYTHMRELGAVQEEEEQEEMGIQMEGTVGQGRGGGGAITFHQR